ncbi:hypothetical protein PSTG_11884 [Puccinia striiformis f. sp. tritici PST-78]|uniref:Uncharacterized protein n=1 Tax=Puccinia striiformis f. sp. tritici PST-78 TaxID=1165861 RepID=A0A0L0V686_9BASI|nr:hypothetical protein PSTG_11884 [Puccinia striiformis f. sp. tritici PST-78]
MHSRLVPSNHSASILLNPQTQSYDLELYIADVSDRTLIFSSETFNRYLSQNSQSPSLKWSSPTTSSAALRPRMAPTKCLNGSPFLGVQLNSVPLLGNSIKFKSTNLAIPKDNIHKSSNTKGQYPQI